jgi:hypothetical protein
MRGGAGRSVRAGDITAILRTDILHCSTVGTVWIFFILEGGSKHFMSVFAYLKYPQTKMSSTVSISAYLEAVNLGMADHRQVYKYKYFYNCRLLLFFIT